MRKESFKIPVPDAALTDLMNRLVRTRWPGQVEAIGWEQGTDRAYLETLVNYWRSEFDWRAQSTTAVTFGRSSGFA